MDTTLKDRVIKEIEAGNVYLETSGLLAKGDGIKTLQDAGVKMTPDRFDKDAMLVNQKSFSEVLGNDGNMVSPALRKAREARIEARREQDGDQQMFR